jgi:hypothetical protein
MNDDIHALEMILELTPGDFDMFKAGVRTLLGKTFVIRGIEKEEVLYDFVIRNIALYDAYFGCMDAVIVRDESLGVIHFRGFGDTRLRLNRLETCSLLVARLLYEEQKTKLSLTTFPTISVEDFKEKYKNMTNSDLTKTNLAEVLHRLQTHKLIELTNNDTSDHEGLVILYPSIALTVDRDSIEELLKQFNESGKAGTQKSDTNDVASEDTGPRVDIGS